jgi:hypothetical protein
VIGTFLPRYISDWSATSVRGTKNIPSHLAFEPPPAAATALPETCAL